MRALIIHVPWGFSSDDWSHNYINIMPMGLFSIASYAKQCSHDVRVMNVACYGSKVKALEVLVQQIEVFACQVIGLSIHWHFTAPDVINAAREIRKRYPNIFIVVGGFTASIYAIKFLEKCNAIDAVVQGEGEIPFARLLDEISKGNSRNLSRVPNLHWRNSGDGIVSNPVNFVATSAELSSFDFGLDSMCDVREYSNGSSMFEAIRGDNTKTMSEPIEDRWFFISTSRGCNLNCIYCAGCRASYEKFFRRRKLSVRAIDSIVNSVASARRHGFRTIHIGVDPPMPGRDTYLKELFESIGKQIKDLSLVMEFYRLPSRDIIRACSKSFEQTIFALSPCFFNQELRKVFKGYFFTDEDLMQKLVEIKQYKNCRAFVFYAITGIESWREPDVRNYSEIIKNLRNRYLCQVSVFPILLEPGSPWVEFPALFPGQHHKPLTFDDFWAGWSQKLDHWHDGFVYKIDRINNICKLIGVGDDSSIFHSAK